MILDSSAVVALLTREAESPALAAALAREPQLAISAVTWLEAAMVIESRRNPVLIEGFDALMRESRIEIVAVDADLAVRAREAWRRWGKGNHPARLNFGDCFSYALAQARDDALLYKGEDFSQTDVKAAL